MAIKNIIFDLDDSIVHCSVNYKRRKTLFATRQHERTGINEQTCLDILNQIDIASTKLGDTYQGFHKERYPTSFRAASAVLDIVRGHAINLNEMESMYALGEGVFGDIYPVMEGAEEIVRQLKGEGYQLFILSKGDTKIQHRKVIDANLEIYFPKGHVYTNLIKTKKEVEQILNDHNLVNHETVFIGDSLRDDIKSGREAGIWTILLEHPHGNPIWHAEEEIIKPHFKIQHINQLPAKLEMLNDTDLTFEILG